MDDAARARLDADMARLGEGDRSAFAPVFAALWPVLQAFAARVLDPADAEDAAQRTLERLFSRASEYDPSRSALAWCVGAVAWECRTMRKARGRRRETPLDAAADVPLLARSPEDDVESTELIAAARTVLGELSVADRATILDSLSGDAPEGVAGATFRKRRERAFNRLRAAFRRVHGGS